MKEEFTLSVYTEDVIGILNKVSNIFNRRHINLKSITASPSEIEGIHRYTIVIDETETQVKKIIGQIEKQVDVAKAFYYRKEQVVFQELALFKLHTASFTTCDVEKLLRKYGAHIVDVTTEYAIVEKSGWHEDIQDLFNALKEDFEVLEYTNSGRVAISKEMKLLETYLEELNT